MQRIEAEHGRSFSTIDEGFLAMGLTDRQIADRLDISINTLREYRHLLGVRAENRRCLVPAS
jgi:hypothetical protein